MLVRLPTARSSSRSIALTEWKRSSGFRDSARASTADTDFGRSGRTSRSGGRSSGGYSPVSVAKAVAASCHWSLAVVGAHSIFGHSGGIGIQRRWGVSPSGISALGIAHSHPSR